MKNLAFILVLIQVINLPTYCCGYPVFQNSRVLQQCRTRNQKGPEKTIDSESCAQECFFNTTRIWRNTQLVKPAVVNAFTKFVPQQWQNLVRRALSYCIPQYKSYPPIPQNPMLRMLPIGSNCNDGPYNLYRCIGEQILRYCPAQKFRKSNIGLC
ncbi:hypothetical protein DMENIID0001_142150 [Sergentomyia squamirostris]